MKHISKYIFGVLMFIGFVNGVSAKEVELKCNYSVDFSSILGKSIDFEALYYKDGSASISSFSNINGSDNLGGYYIIGDSSFKKQFKDYVKNSNNCPSVYFEQIDGSNLQITTIKDPKKNNYITSTSKGSSSETGNVETKEELVCQQHIKAMRNEDYWNVTFNWYKIGNKRYWSAGMSTDEANSSTKYDVDSYSLPTIGEYSYKMSNAMISDVYDKGNCAKQGDNYHFWLECTGSQGSSQNITLVLNQPADEKNCSYGVNDAKKDNGLDVDNNPASPTYNSHYTSTDGKTACFFKKIYNLLKILVPLAVIIFSIVDFLKVLFLSDDKNYKEAYAKLIRRVLIGILIFMVPSLIEFVINLAGMNADGILTIFNNDLVCN